MTPTPTPACLDCDGVLIAVGDWVECVDAKDWEEDLVAGERYQVASFSTSLGGKHTVRLKPPHSAFGFRATRFRRLPPQPQPAAQPSVDKRVMVTHAYVLSDWRDHLNREGEIDGLTDRALKAGITALEAQEQFGPAWGDKPLPEDAEIDKAHPISSGRHDLYMEAMRLVGARHSKAGLVNLVTWLLSKRGAK